MLICLYILTWSRLVPQQTSPLNASISSLFFLCRASIVQKRIIYFQDEGSLTKRMCEKGRLLLLTWNKKCTMNFLSLQSPCWYSISLPTDSLFFFFLVFFYSIFFFLSFLILMRGLSPSLLCSGMWMIVNECNPWLCMTLDATLSNRSKALCYTSSLFFLMPFFFHWLPTFLNRPSPIWWEPLSSTPYTNHCMTVSWLSVSLTLALSLFPSSPLPSFHCRIPVWRHYRKTSAWLLCLWNSKVQSHLLWELVREDSSQRLPT